jgi:hypothetical protein
MASQGVMAPGGVIWGSVGAITGASYTLFGAAVLILGSVPGSAGAAADV